MRFGKYLKIQDITYEHTQVTKANEVCKIRKNGFGTYVVNWRIIFDSSYYYILYDTSNIKVKETFC
jgi:hypothetical protein